MAILIPSKNIYDKQNPKIRDNVVDNVSVSQKIVSPHNEIDTSLSSQSFYEFPFSAALLPPINKNFVDANNSLNNYSKVGNATGIKLFIKLSQFSFRVPKQKSTTEFVKSISLEQATFNIAFQKQLYNLISTFNPVSENFDFDSNNISKISTEDSLDYTYNFSKVESNISTDREADIRKFDLSITREKIEANVNTSFFELGYSDGALTSNATISTTDFLQSYEIRITDTTEEYYEISAYGIPSEITISMLYSRPIGTSSSWSDVNYQAFGYRVVLNPINIDFSFKGNTIGISLTDGTVQVGEGSKPFSLDGNELLQDSGMVGDKLITQHLGDNVLEQYANGKETATLLCDISDYYEYDEGAPNGKGAKAISIDTERMTFRLHDEVIPMVFGADGQDRPMSLRKDRTPKVFSVVGSKIIYDGAVWQELTLQEKTEGI